MLSPAELLALCAYEEARNQPDDGVAAVARVVLTRARLGYQCDRTIASAVERHAQFSWTEYEMGPTGYRRVAFTTAEELAHIDQLYAAAQKDRAPWERCAAIAAKVAVGEYRGPLFGRLTPDTVLYCNPAACARPPWATPLALVVRIGAHEFYRDLAWNAAHGGQTAAPKLQTA